MTLAENFPFPKGRGAGPGPGLPAGGPGPGSGGLRLRRGPDGYGQRPGALRTERRSPDAHRQHHEDSDGPGGHPGREFVRHGEGEPGGRLYGGFLHVSQGGGGADPGDSALRFAPLLRERRRRGGGGACGGQRGGLCGADERNRPGAGDGGFLLRQPQRPGRRGALFHRLRHGPAGPGGHGKRDPGPHCLHPDGDHRRADHDEPQ